MLLHQVLHAEPRAPRAVDGRVPKDLETICLKAMAKEPAQRYASAGELAADMRRWINDEPILARPSGAIELFWRWARRPERVRDAGWLGILLCSIGLFFLTTWLVYSWVAGLEIARPAEFLWQTAMLNGVLLLGVYLGRKILGGSQLAMGLGLAVNALLFAVLVLSMGDWLPVGIRFRAGGVYDDSMVRITLFSLFSSMALVEGLLLCAALAAQRRNRA
jgi:hypothetical protein